MGPIFVGGASRSGKTLMRWMLSSHSRIVVSRRTEMWPRYFGRFGDLRRPDNFERCLRAMLERKQIASLAPDTERLRTEFARGPRTYGRLFALVHEQLGERSGKPRWGDQSAGLEHYADDLMSAYPGARLIHLVRDPRDRHLAIMDRGPRRPGEVGRSVAGWLQSIAVADRNVRRHPRGCKVVRYESLVTRPEETMRDVCSFVDEEFEPAMLRMEDVGRYRDQRAVSADGSPITTAYVGLYRERLDRCDVAFIQAVARGQMIALRYPPDPLVLSVGERARCASSGWPLSLASMGMGRVLQTMRGRRIAAGQSVPGR